jgi:hypothetical protein
MTLARHGAIIALGAAFSYGVLLFMLLETHANGLSSWWAMALWVPTWAGTRFAGSGGQTDNAAFFAAWYAQCAAGGIIIDLVVSYALRKKKGALPPST